MTRWLSGLALIAALMAVNVSAAAQQLAAVRVEGQVQAGGGPLANSTVTLWAGSRRPQAIGANENG